MVERTETRELLNVTISSVKTGESEIALEFMK